MSLEDDVRFSVPDAAAFAGMSQAYIRKALTRKMLRRVHLGSRVFVLRSDLLALMKVSGSAPNGAGEGPRLVA